MQSLVTNQTFIAPPMLFGSRILGPFALFFRHEDEMVDFRAHLTINSYYYSFFILDIEPLTVRIVGEAHCDDTDTSR